MRAPTITESGREAFRLGKAADENPFRIGSTNATLWADGYKAEQAAAAILQPPALEDLILTLDATFSDLDAARRKGYLRRDMPKLHAAADAIRAKRQRQA